MFKSPLVTLYPCRVIPFPATHRSVLERVRSEDAEVRRLAFGDLAEGYWRPSYHYLRLHWRLSPEAAEDACRRSSRRRSRRATSSSTTRRRRSSARSCGSCLDRFVQNLQKAERAGKRGGGATHLSLDFPGAEQELAARSPRADLRDADRFFHDETIRALFAPRRSTRMRAPVTREGQAGSVPRLRAARSRSRTPETSYATVAARAELTVAQVTNHLHAARRRFRELALDTSARDRRGTDDEFRARSARALRPRRAP